ncbi:phosphotransferase family protein (plasmid) [Lysinibacillus sp. fkY74-1]
MNKIKNHFKDGHQNTEHQEVIKFLLEQKLIKEKSIVNGGLTIVDVSRRNHNFKIISKEGPCYFLKQGVTPNKKTTVSREAAMYEFFLTDKGNDGFTRYLPHFYGYDSERHILITECLKEAQNLREYHTRLLRFSTSLAAEMGNALGTLHRLTPKINNDKDIGIFKHEPPPVFSIHCPTLRIFQDISKPNIQIIKIIQQFPEFCEQLTSLKQEWRTDTLINFDIKWENCMVPYKLAQGKDKGLKIIDWELAGLGDPCWDIGSVFIDYLFFWLLSIPITSETLSEKVPVMAPYPLSKLQPAIRSFWESYFQRMELDSITSSELLLRAVKYASARLLKTTFEQMQMSKQLTGNVIFSLQLSQNMIQRPREAIKHLLGISL